LTDLDAKADALKFAKLSFESAAVCIRDGHKALAQAGENNCKTKQWLKCGITVANSLADLAQRAQAATKKAIEVHSNRGGCL